MTPNPITLEAVYPSLCAPFPVELIEVRPGVTNRDKTKSLAAPYADVRVYQQRLDDIVGPSHWQVVYRPWDDKAVICQLGILGVVREDASELTGQGDYQYTTAIARAFKRACTTFGLGRYLYNLPAVWADYEASRRSFTNPKAVVREIYQKAGILNATASPSPKPSATSTPSSTPTRPQWSKPTPR